MSRDTKFSMTGTGLVLKQTINGESMNETEGGLTAKRSKVMQLVMSLILTTLIWSGLMLLYLFFLLDALGILSWAT